MGDDIHTKRSISHLEAHESLKRLINSHFNQKPHARASIPARPDYDDDLVLGAYIQQRIAADEAYVTRVTDLLAANNAEMERRRDLETLVEFTNTFQVRVHEWVLACFGRDVTTDTDERNHRFLEEALELVQACGCTASEAHQLVDYVYGRPVGERAQELGGVLVTVAALAVAQRLEMIGAGETELRRVWQKIDQIRAKQAAKPKHSPLPGPTP